MGNHQSAQFKTYSDPEDADPSEAMEASYAWEDLRNQKLMESDFKVTPLIVMCEVMRLDELRWAQQKSAGVAKADLPKRLGGDNVMSVMFSSVGGVMDQRSAEIVALRHVQHMYDVGPAGDWGSIGPDEIAVNLTALLDSWASGHECGICTSVGVDERANIRVFHRPGECKKKVDEQGE